MRKPSPDHVTALLDDMRRGDQNAAAELVAVVYPELRRIAARYLRSERPDHTLQPTALVHETFARLVESDRTNWKSRAHFFSAVATEMRRILVDYARARKAQKRPGRYLRISLTDAQAIPSRQEEDLLALDEALGRLGTQHARASRVVELRFFTGLDERETAEALGLSIATVKRDWQFAKAWLFDQLRSSSHRGEG